MAAVCHTEFLRSRNFIGFMGSKGPKCITLPNFIKTGQYNADIAISYFSKWLPSTILDF